VFNKDGKVDLFSDPIDAIGSIANYFDKHQWHDYGEIARPISLGFIINNQKSSLVPSQKITYLGGIFHLDLGIVTPN
jgi:membrane-bound lytic murein transglycosylase B